jgi:competence protein ComEA
VDDRGSRALAWGVAGVVAVLLCARLIGGDEGPPPVRVGGGQKAARRSPGPPVRRLVIHVAGAVRRPGLYRLEQGSRVAGAIERAGGPRGGADLGAINLAATLEDGQQVFVPARTAQARAGVADAESTAPISLGAATAEELETLDGIGPTLARRIVEARRASGGFSSIDDLADVEGIGTQRLESLKEALAP